MHSKETLGVGLADRYSHDRLLDWDLLRLRVQTQGSRVEGVGLPIASWLIQRLRALGLPIVGQLVLRFRVEVISGRFRLIRHKASPRPAAIQPPPLWQSAYDYANAENATPSSVFDRPSSALIAPAAVARLTRST